MSDLAAMRAACQRGEMPRFGLLADAVSDRAGEDWWRPTQIVTWNGGRHLDGLAALQEALWPGSRFAADCYNGYTVVIVSPHSILINQCSNRCPTLATAWLDAILAGIESEKDHD